MLSLAEKVPAKPIVFGGSANSILKKWLRQLGVTDFLHADVIVRSIAAADMKLSADYIRTTYGHADVIFTVGAFSDKVLTIAKMDHGALPSTSTKDQKAIEAALNRCRNYLLRSIYNVPTIPPPGSPNCG